LLAIKRIDQFIKRVGSEAGLLEKSGFFMQDIRIARITNIRREPGIAFRHNIKTKNSTMRKFLLTIGFVLLCTSAFAQDVIIKDDGTEIKADVKEITVEDVIKYKNYNHPDGPIRSIKAKKVLMIIYENGKREKFIDNKNDNPVQKSDSTTQKVDSTKAEDPPPIQQQLSAEENEESENHPRPQTTQTQSQSKEEEGGYFAIVPGLGNSYGGYGVKLQVLTKGNVPVGFHGGVGYFPKLGGWVLYSGGIQIYFWDYMYLNAQFGAFGAKSFSVSSGGFGGNFTTIRASRIYGPSLLLGYDWLIGDHFGINLASGVSYNMNQPEGPLLETNGLWWALDAGIILRF
jgi:hypothetical protein